MDINSSLTPIITLISKGMAYIFAYEIKASDVIALASLIVAIFSARYTYSTLSATKNANEISLLERRTEIYEAFRALKMHMLQSSIFADKQEISKFYYYSENAKIYFSADLAEDMRKYFNACFQLAEIHIKYGGTNKESSIENKSYIDIEKSLAPKIDMQIFDILKRTQI